MSVKFYFCMEKCQSKRIQKNKENYEITMVSIDAHTKKYEYLLEFYFERTSKHTHTTAD